MFMINKSNPIYLPVRNLILSLLAITVGGLWIGCSSKGKWEKLADLRDSTGTRYVVAQQHYDLLEGWRVSFSMIDPSNRVYGSLLAMKTEPWRNAKIIEKGNVVELWHGEQKVGALDRSTKVFTNYIRQTSDKYVPGFNEVQGKIVTNLYFDRK